MRSTKALFATIFFVLLCWPTGPTGVVLADDDVSEEESDEYDVTARVMRTSMLQGEVTLQRAGAKEWERATLNLPLLEGDTLATASGARLEIQIDARNFLRVGADSVLRIVTLRDNGIALSLTQGTVTLRLARFDADKEYFEMDAPKSTLSAEKPGLYRLDVTPEGRVRFTVRGGGSARIYSETAGFKLREERMAELVDSGSEEGDWQLAGAAAFDAWDTWVEERERSLATRLRYEERERYYDQDIWGAEELDDYGEWVSAPEYGGWVWCPRLSALNSYPNWAPYRYGHWRWRPPYGWTWVADEPWGWAPYHYGRWVYYNNSWCWAPRGYGYQQRRKWWRPALVALSNVTTSYGDEVAWYPLTHGQHDPYRRNRGRHEERPGQPRPHDRGNRRPFQPGGVTCVPAREFGNHWARPRPANTDIARRAVNNDPTHVRLPVAPRDGDQDISGNRGRDRRERNWPARNPSVNPPGHWRERPTGAAARQPGAPIDNEQRRTRFYNGRAPHPSSSPAEGGAQPSDRSTGAVERPARPSRPSRDQDTDVDRNFRNNWPSRERPDRPARTRPQDGASQRPPGVPSGEGVRPREREPRQPGEQRQPRAPRAEPLQPRAPGAEAPSQPAAEVPPQPTDATAPADSNGPAAAQPESPQTAERPSRPERRAPIERDEPTDRPAERPVRRLERVEPLQQPHQPSRAPQPQAAQPSIEAAQPQPEAPRVEPSAPVTQTESPAIAPSAPTSQPSTPEPQPATPASQPERAEPQPEAPRVEAAPPAPMPEPAAPQREEPSPQREEPARREEPPPTPAPPPEPVSAPPPPSEPSSPPPSPPSEPSSPPPAPDPPAPAPEPPRSDPPPAPEPPQPEAAKPPQD